jgi:hypothetical protein
MKTINLILGTLFCVSLAFASGVGVTPAAGTLETQLLNGGPIPPPWDFDGESQFGGPIPPPWDFDGESQLGGPIPPPWDFDNPLLSSDGRSVL